LSDQGLISFFKEKGVDGFIEFSAIKQYARDQENQNLLL